MNLTEYFAAVGSGLTNDEAKSVGTWLDDLGWPSVREVVAAARPPESPGHPHFTWDDSVAGEKWREEEGRRLVRAIVVHPRGKEEDDAEEVRAFFSLPVGICQPPVEEQEPIDEHARRRYVPIREVVKNEPHATAILGEAHRALKMWREKYEIYLALFQEFGVFRKLLEEMGRLDLELDPDPEPDEDEDEDEE